MPRRARRTGAAFVDNERERDITFFKRRNGLFKAASDLSILTGASIAVVLEDQSREKFHAVGTPTVETVVNAALSDGMEPTEPFVDEQLRGRLEPLENELAWLKDESEKNKERTQASKDRYREAQEEKEDDDEDDIKMKRLFLSNSDNLHLDEMNELFAELLQIQEQVRERVPPLRRRRGQTLINFQGSSVPAPPPQWPNLFGPYNQLLPVAPAPVPFVADQAPPPSPPAPAAGGSLWIPEVPPPPPAGSPWANLFPLQPPRFAEGMEPSFFGSQAQQAPAPGNTQLEPLPPIPEQAPLLQEPFLFSDQAPTLAPLPPEPLQMPVESHFPLEAPLVQEPFPFSNQASAYAPMSVPLQMFVEDFPVSPLLQEPLPFSDQAPENAPTSAPFQMPVEDFPASPLLQEPLPISDQASELAPLPAPLQMPMEAHFPLSALLQEPFDFSDEAPVFSPMPDQAPVNDPPSAPFQMPMEAHLPPAAEAYNQEVAEQQHLPQGYENYDHIFENVEPSQPLAAGGAGDDGSSSAVGKYNLFGHQQWAASPLYDGQFYLSTGIDGMGVAVGGDVPEADLANVEQSSSSGWGNDIY